jgi:hypothetical protein
MKIKVGEPYHLALVCQGSTYGPGKAAYGGHWRPPENERSGRHSAFRHDDKGLTEFTVTGQNM